MNRIFPPQYLELHQNPRKSKWYLVGASLQHLVYLKRYKPFSVADTVATEAFRSQDHHHGLLVWGKKAAMAQLCLWTSAHIHHGTLALYGITKILFQVSENLVTCKLFRLPLQNHPPILGKHRVSQQKLATTAIALFTLKYYAMHSSMLRTCPSLFSRASIPKPVNLPSSVFLLVRSIYRVLHRGHFITLHSACCSHLSHIYWLA